MKTISGIEALERMRDIRHNELLYFSMKHYTLNRTKQTTNGIRVVREARLRPALPEEFSRNIDPDSLLPYTDIVTGENRMAYKVLIRSVAFPPHFEVLKVKWHEKK
jgi:hypothetical protein